jgi:hypothetical protein
MRRGGRRGRYVTCEDAAVTCAGRWGRRCVRVNAVLGDHDRRSGVHGAAPGEAEQDATRRPWLRQVDAPGPLPLRRLGATGECRLALRRTIPSLPEVRSPCDADIRADRGCMGRLRAMLRMTYESRQRRNYMGALTPRRLAWDLFRSGNG